MFRACLVARSNICFYLGVFKEWFEKVVFGLFEMVNPILALTLTLLNDTPILLAIIVEF